MLVAVLFLCLTTKVAESSSDFFSGTITSSRGNTSGSGTFPSSSGNHFNSGAFKSPKNNALTSGAFESSSSSTLSSEAFISSNNLISEIATSSTDNSLTQSSGTLRGKSGANRYPYHAKVSIGRSLTCSGVLVHPEIILTAAQCWRENTKMTVKIGQQTVDVSEARPHSSWNNNFPYDIMAIHLETRIEGIMPVQMMKEGSTSLSSDDQLLVLNGDDADEFPVSESSFKDCNDDYAYQLDKNKHVCATTETCVAFQGGGPLIVAGTDSERDVLVGMASFHQKDNCGGSLGFTRLSGYSFWVLEQTCAMALTDLPEDCPKPSAAPSVSMIPTSTPSESPSLSMEPTAPTNEPTESPTLPLLDCSEYSGCDPNDPEKVSICTVHEDTKMTTQACSRKNEVWFHGFGDHYCGPCQNTCYELEERYNPRDPCDDTMYCKFQIDTPERDYSAFNKNSHRNGSMQRCTWLHGQTEEIRAQYCAVGQEARELCPETCGVCTDDCEDSPTAEVMVNGSLRTCEYLQLRPNIQQEVCIQGSEVWNTCREYCGNCIDMTNELYWEILNATKISRDGTQITTAPSPAPTATPVPTISPAPTTLEPTTSKPTRDCMECTDIGNVWMQSQGEECHPSHYFINRKCIKNKTWRKNKYCQHTCYHAGFGYEGDDCCETLYN